MALSCVFLVTAILCLSAADIPENRILQVKPVCGSDGREDASINIITDLDIQAKAECAGDVVVGFTSDNNVIHTLPVSYPGRGSNPCVFNKRTNTHVYVIQVQVSYGEPGQFVHREHEEYTITCTFDPKSTDESSDTSLDDAQIAPHEIQTLRGAATISTLDLQLVDVLGNDISGREVWRSRKVQLKATTTGEGGERGIRPVSCDAIGQSGGRYAIVRAGCGDGLIFGKTVGFNTVGLTSKSPFFESFGIQDDARLRFECNFTLCDESCDGGSCDIERKRRSGLMKNDLRRVLVVSKEITVAVQAPSEQISSWTRVMDVDDEQDTSPISNAAEVYWAAIVCVGLLVTTSLSVSLIICLVPRRIQHSSIVKA